MLSAHIRLTDKKGGRVKIYVEEQHNLSKKFSKAIYKQHREIYDTYVEQLSRLQRLDVLAIDSPQLIAFGMLGMVNWCYRWFRSGGALTIEQVTERLIQMIFNGILKPGVSWSKADAEGKDPSPLRRRRSSKDAIIDDRSASNRSRRGNWSKQKSITKMGAVILRR
jgi:hypothetical protein